MPGVDSGDYTYPPGSESFGGALIDVPRRYSVRTCAERHDEEIARLWARIEDLERVVAELLDKQVTDALSWEQHFRKGNK